MSKPAVSSIVEELITEGLVWETGQGQSTVAGGKRPILLELNKDAGLIVAVYFNEQWYEVALTDLSANVLESIKKPTVIHKDYRQTLDELINDIQELVQKARAKGVYQPILACGIAMKGLVNTQLGTLQYSAILDWREIPVSEYMSNQLKWPVYIENDARAITIAEMLFGNGMKTGTFACVSLALGIGTGVVIKNEIVRGANDGAVTFAHTTIKENGPLCSCGNRGCWETLASVSAFLRELADRKAEYRHIELNQALKSFHEGDPFITDVLLNYTAYWMGVGIANILNIFNPEQVIIQGEITTAGEDFRKKIEEVAISRTLPVSRKATISFSQLSGPVQVKGAAAVVINHFYSKEYHRQIWRQEFLA
ncbi:ROK family protein [Paenibacillus filicis]|uniref:ROK family protein n=1 Tax=Paenibacillus gyeongsangnamensis TaxID=3388067 RepID=A0ABT4Q4J1_9BACL|nr:ROK family protein [Paenibacillus filicis]MCZ8511738.1 ROK family protein [Paenibacillus filicis]